MYPDSILGWFLGTAILFFLMIMMGLFAYYMGHWLESRDRKKEDDDGASDE